VLSPEDGKQLLVHLGARRAVEAILANLVAALFVFGYLEYLAPLEHVGSATTSHDVIVFAAFMAVALPLGAAIGATSFRRALRWLAEGRPPTHAEQRSTLSLPFRETVGLLIWLVAATFFGFTSLAYGHTGSHVTKVFVAVTLGGLVATSVDFLLCERGLRPVFALALAADPPTRPITLGLRPRLLLAWALGSGIPLAGIALLPLAAHHAAVRANIGGAVATLAVTGLLIGLLVNAIAARSIADPLDQIRQVLGRVENGVLDVGIPIDDGGEIGRLQAGVNQMVAGLRDRQRLADLFGRHVGAEVAKQALEQGSGLVSEEREASVLFVDLVGSTALARSCYPRRWWRPSMPCLAPSCGP
jgi:adenylate cyclase